MLSIQAVRGLPRLRAPEKTMETVKNLPASVGVDAMHRGHVPPPANIWSAGDEVSYTSGKVCQVSAAIAC